MYGKQFAVKGELGCYNICLPVGSLACATGTCPAGDTSLFGQIQAARSSVWQYTVGV
ncbi:hypothetical protein MYCOZU1_02884 [Mycobacterium intracellulare subsp. chimaera]|nr:hypothetical protein MYCODSM44623_02771 [Mycobacterium intracellulare subsp. chimaera]ASL21298.1 hypothetical protein MYCOZU1_02884 [Mycobacterium intracellulare subsp. chimaera]